MRSHVWLAAAATLIATAFALSTLERFLADRRRHQLAWTISLVLFAAGSAALWTGAALGWDEWSFRLFYLFGAIANVPFLALGTVYLLAGERTGDRWARLVVVFTAFCAGAVAFAPLIGTIAPDQLPRGSEVFGPGPRIMAAVASGVGALVLIGGAAWSAVRIVRTHGAGNRRAGERSAARRLVAANVLIASGTVVLSLGGVLNSVVDEMDAFAISLAVGISIIFVGFLLTNGPRASRDQHAGDLDPRWLIELVTEPATASAMPSAVHPTVAPSVTHDLATLQGPREN